jgi:trehalose 6-phosphate phosphatase
VTQHELRSAVGELLAGREKVALYLDFDGTLAPIVGDPDGATLPAETRRHLVALANSPAVDVAVISGRALDDIRSRVDIAGIEYAGNHGFERGGDGDAWVHPAVERHRPVLDRARRRLERELDSVPGCFVEDKYATLTVHHRRAGPDEGSLAIAAVQTVVDDEEGLSMVVDEQAVEIRPAIDYGKGDAVEELFDADPETLAIYFGDAQTDVDAFRTLSAWDDETVHVSVGDALPASGHHLESPADVERFLRWLRIELGDLQA